MMHVGEQVDKSLSISIENPEHPSDGIPSWYPHMHHDIPPMSDVLNTPPPPDVLMISPRCTHGIPQMYWTLSLPMYWTHIIQCENNIPEFNWVVFGIQDFSSLFTFTRNSSSIFFHVSGACTWTTLIEAGVQQTYQGLGKWFEHVWINFKYLNNVFFQYVFWFNCNTQDTEWWYVRKRLFRYITIARFFIRWKYQSISRTSELPVRSCENRRFPL